MVCFDVRLVAIRLQTLQACTWTETLQWSPEVIDDGGNKILEMDLRLSWPDATIMMI